MAISHEIEVCTQNSIYNNLNRGLYDRKLKVYFSVPEKGVNEDTGLLLIIAGFGGQASSNVYKKMRDKFSDEHNLVTVQCDYFGYEFMQESPEIRYCNLDKEQLQQLFSVEDISNIYKTGQLDFKTFLTIGSKYNISVKVEADIKENIDNFNEMGLLQGLDNVVAVLNVMNFLYENDYCFNNKKVIIYGHSHGAYIAYLCNAVAPSLFSLIIDNSAWVYPVYLSSNRYLFNSIGKLIVVTKFDYLAKKIIDDKEILNLAYLYEKFNNNCRIISYHGSTDDLINCRDKGTFCSKINKCTYNEISENNIDNIIFKSTNHGLDADFIKLFNFTMNELNIQFEKDSFLDLQEEVVFETSKHKYVIDYKNILPKIYIL